MIIKIENIQLEKGYLFVEPYEPEVEGYALNLSAEDKPYYGRIVNVSNKNKWFSRSKYNVNDIILFRREMYSSMSVNGKVYNLMMEEDVIGIITQ
jgi:co-chaperonin GroES (HSP10)